MRHIVSSTLLLFLVLAFSSYAAANAITYTGSGISGTFHLSASATFDLTGSTLTVTLTNTSTDDAKDATEILGAVLFNTSTTLTPTSASVAPGSSVFGSFVHNVGEGWEYKSPVSVHSMNSGISAVGYGVFGPSGNFFSPSVHLGGSNYGIAPIGFTNTGNPSIEDPIIKNSIVFTLSAPGFSLGELGRSVVFQYGTSLTEPNFVGTVIPEPSTLALFGAGVLGMTGFIRRRLR